MKNLKLLLLSILIILTLNLFSEVELQEVNITTELTGPFSVNRAEFIFHNNSDEDAQQANILFELNSSAVVTDMWLEINGKMVLDETFRIDTGTKIYEEFIPRKKDPALLVKTDESNYRLRVFPFAAKQTRKVVINYYSVMETLNDELTWQFNVIPRGIWGREHKSKITVNGLIEDEYMLRYNFNSDKIIPDEEGRFILSAKDDISFNLEIIKAYGPYSPKIGYSGIDALAHKIKYLDSYERIENIGIVPHFVEKYLRNLDTKKFLINSKVKLDNEFITEFYKYLEHNHPNSLPYFQIYSNFYKQKEMIYYLDPKFSFKSKTNFFKSLFIPGSYKCIYLHNFYDYCNVMSEDIDAQIKSRFLTPFTSKLVLEDSEEATKIRKKALKQENAHISYNSMDDDDIDILYSVSGFSKTTLGQTSRFATYEDFPVAIKRVKPVIHKDLLYLLDTTGDVWLEVEVFSSGKVGMIDIIQSLHPILDQAAIDAVIEWEFIPAKSGSEPVNCIVTFPITFEFDKKYKPNLEDKNNSFILFDKKFQFIDDEWAMNGFSPLNSNNTEIYSNKFWSILKDNPELINIVYWFCMKSDFQKLGIVTNSGQSIWLIR